MRRSAVERRSHVVERRAVVSTRVLRARAARSARGADAAAQERRAAPSGAPSPSRRSAGTAAFLARRECQVEDRLPCVEPVRRGREGDVRALLDAVERDVAQRDAVGGLHFGRCGAAPCAPLAAHLEQVGEIGGEAHREAQLVRVLAVVADQEMLHARAPCRRTSCGAGGCSPAQPGASARSRSGLVISAVNTALSGRVAEPSRSGLAASISSAHARGRACRVVQAVGDCRARTSKSPCGSKTAKVSPCLSTLAGAPAARRRARCGSRLRLRWPLRRHRARRAWGRLRRMRAPAARNPMLYRNRDAIATLRAWCATCCKGSA